MYEESKMHPALEAFLAAAPGNAAILRDECRKAGEFVVSDVQAKIVGVQPTLMRAARLIKHHLPDGEYNIVGLATDLLLYRKDGIVYPAGGHLEVAGEVVGNVQFIEAGCFPPRNLDECKDVFKEN
jgi:hypothetical protein